MKKIMFLIFIFFVSINNVIAKEKVKLSSCIDGDTIKVIINNKTSTVRFLAINTPEYSPTKIEYYGKEASEYTCDRVTNAKKIELEYDDNSDREDKYGRVLAWVFVDGKLLEEELVEKGYAKVAYLYADYKYTNTLKEKQELASAKNIGVWNREKENNFLNNSHVLDESSNDDIVEDSIQNIEVIIIGIVMLVITFIGKLTIDKNKSKDKCKKR